MKGRILIADDERAIADTLATILEMHGFETRTAYDGHQAMEIAMEWRPQILLTDVLMPGMDGVEAAMAICRMLPDCRVLLLSGLTANRDLADRIRRSGHDFEILHKPIPPDELLACLGHDGRARGGA
jgi:DNA-binding response OmpR family regulator